MDRKLNAVALGWTAAVLAALSMLILGILGNFGLYTGAVEMMQKWHLFFDLSIGGIIAGIIEAAVISFITGYLFGWLYNMFTGE